MPFIFSSLSYAIPSLARWINDVDIKNEKYNLTRSQELGCQIGFFAGVASFSSQAIVYGYLACNDHPEVLLVPLITNLVSGSIEFGRRKYQKAKERLIEKRSKGLDDFVQRPESNLG